MSSVIFARDHDLAKVLGQIFADFRAEVGFCPIIGTKTPQFLPLVAPASSLAVSARPLRRML